MEQNKTPRKTALFGNQLWMLPFQASGFWVSDAKGHDVCDCKSYELAKAMADLLNKSTKSS